MIWHRKPDLNLELDRDNDNGLTMDVSSQVNNFTRNEDGFRLSLYPFRSISAGFRVH